MKTAEEWIESDYVLNVGEKCRNFTAEQIKQVQLDAYRAGMSEAAAICLQARSVYEESQKYTGLDCIQACQNIRSVILSVRDAKTEI